MSHTLNAALVGYGFAGKTFHAPFLSTTPGLSLSWVVSRDAAKVQADLPGELVAELDRLKDDAGLRGRAPIIEEALRFYIEAKQGT